MLFGASCGSELLKIFGPEDPQRLLLLSLLAICFFVLAGVELFILWLEKTPMTETNLLKGLIISDLNSRSHMAWRNNTTGIYDPVKRRFRRNLDRSAIGTADIICCVKGGLYVEIELKIGRDKQSTGQLQHEQAVKRAGGRYFIVGCWEEYVDLRRIEGW